MFVAHVYAVCCTFTYIMLHISIHCVPNLYTVLCTFYTMCSAVKYIALHITCRMIHIYRKCAAHVHMVCVTSRNIMLHIYKQCAVNFFTLCGIFKCSVLHNYTHCVHAYRLCVPYIQRVTSTHFVLNIYTHCALYLHTLRYSMIILSHTV